MFWPYVLEAQLLGVYAFRIMTFDELALYHYVIFKISGDILCFAIYIDSNITLTAFFL